ncbi:hypothetical protein FSARC_10238, partial [Fusarium sarcochroum]
MRWSKLPAELRLEVLEYLARVTYYHRKRKTLAKYATVSPEWQIFFEGHTMRSIEVKQSEIDTFRFIFRTKRRRRCLRNIGLVLELELHDTTSLWYPEGATRNHTFGEMWLLASQPTVLPMLVSEAVKRNKIFARTAQALFCELSPWRKSHVWHTGINLEIIAKSKSFWQKEACKLQPSTDPVVFGTQTFSKSEQEQILEAAKADFRSSIGLYFKSAAPKMPQVKVITSLSILRKSVRHFDPRALARLMGYLPSLKTFVWEMRPRGHRNIEHELQEQLSTAIKDWPSGLNDVQISQPTPFDNYLTLSPSLAMLSANLADRAQCLSCLSLRHCTDAVEFFKPGIRRFPNMKYLTLRSKQLVVDELPSSGHYLLGLTAKAVSCMPKLRNLTLFNMHGDHIGLLTYEISDNMLTLKLRCSWPFEIREGTIGLLRDSLKRGRSESLRWGSKLLLAERVKAHIASALYRNKLSVERH